MTIKTTTPLFYRPLQLTPEAKRALILAAHKPTQRFIRSEHVITFLRKVKEDGEVPKGPVRLIGLGYYGMKLITVPPVEARHEG